MKKLLIIRFSSFGDIFHGLEAACELKESGFEVHWATRSDYASLLETVPEINKVWSLEKDKGLSGLIELTKVLKQENFTHVYDAHNNLRSMILCFFIRFPSIFNSITFVRRSKNRWKRFLLFKLKINKFPKPYYSVLSFIEPIQSWITQKEIKKRSLNFKDIILDQKTQDFLAKNNHILLAPSAAWELKKWPLQYWQELIKKLPEHVFIVLGGPEDQFCQELVSVDPKRVHNLAGKLSLLESAFVVSQAKCLIAGDTGLMHLGNHLSIPLISLIGPSAFGNPHQPSSIIMSENLSCQPCSKDGRGRCHNKVYKKCLMDITPEKVINKVKSL